MPIPAGEMRRLLDEQRRREMAHRRLRWERRRRRLILWLAVTGVAAALLAAAHLAREAGAIGARHMTAPSPIFSHGEGGEMEQQVFTGTTVSLLREDGRNLRFRLVPPMEANIDHGKLSVATPMGKALLGRRLGEEFSFHTPVGPVRVKVLAIESMPG